MTNPLLETSPYETDNGHSIGRDPREVDTQTLKEQNYKSPTAAIRAKCLDCVGDQPSEVRKCTATNCPLWHLRMGTNPLWGK